MCILFHEGCPEAVGRALLRHLGGKSLERLHMVSHPVAGTLLGVSAAGLCGHERTWGTVVGDWRGPTGAGPTHVPCVASRSRWLYDAHPVSGRDAAAPVYGGVVAHSGQPCGVAKTEGVCREVLKVSEALEIFVCVAGDEPTNNTAERAIRPGVLWRKGSFGTQRAQRLGLSMP
jgi:hypothetical protein